MKNNNLWQVIKFTLFSASAGIIQAGSFTLLHEWAHLPYTVAYLTALILSVLWNFTFNRRYTFRSDSSIPRAMVLVFLFYAVFTPLSAWLGDWMTKGGVNEYITLAVSMGLNFVLEYLYQRFVVYRKSVDTNALAARAKAESQDGTKS